MLTRPRIQSIGARRATNFSAGRDEAGNRVAMIGVVDRADEPGAQRVLEHGPGPGHVRAEVAPGIERQEQFLPTGMELARGAVDRRQGYALQCAVESLALRERIGRRVTRIDEVAVGEVARPGPELAGDRARQRARRSCPRPRARPLSWGTEREPRTSAAASAATTAKSAAMRNDERNSRVNVSRIAVTTASRVSRRFASVAAPRLSNGTVGSGTSPRGALPTRSRRSNANDTFVLAGRPPNRAPRPSSPASRAVRRR